MITDGKVFWLLEYAWIVGSGDWSFLFPIFITNAVYGRYFCQEWGSFSFILLTVLGTQTPILLSESVCAKLWVFALTW